MMFGKRTLKGIKKIVKLMKRNLFFCILMAIAIGASAQIERSITLEEMPVSALNNVIFKVSLTQMAEILSADKAQYATDLETWIYPNRDKSWELEEYPMIYLDSDKDSEYAGAKDHGNIVMSRDGQIDGNDRSLRCIVGVIADMDIIVFELKSSFYGEDYMLKAGDKCHAMIAFEYQGKKATVDLTINIAKQFGQPVDIDALEKVGETSVVIQYLQGHKGTENAAIDMNQVLKCFNTNMSKYCLDLWALQPSDADRIVKTPGSYHFTSTVSATLDKDFAMADGDNGKFLIDIFLANNTISARPLGRYQEGDRYQGSVYLVLDNKYFEVHADVTFGDADASTKNQAIVDAAEKVGTQEHAFTVAPHYPGDGIKGYAAPIVLEDLAKAFSVSKEQLINDINAWINGDDVNHDGSDLLYNLTSSASTRYNERRDNMVDYVAGYDGSVGERWDWKCGIWLSPDDGELRLLLNFIEGAPLIDGDVCHATLGLYYKGKLYTFDMTLNIKANVAEPVAVVGPGKSPNKLIVIKDRESTTSIDTPALTTGKTSIYNLQGQQLSVPTSGLNIINGRKVLVK